MQVARNNVKDQGMRRWLPDEDLSGTILYFGAFQHQQWNYCFLKISKIQIQLINIFYTWCKQEKINVSPLGQHLHSPASFCLFALI